MTIRTKIIILTAILLLLSILGGSLFLILRHSTVLSITAFSVGVLSFFGIIVADQPPGRQVFYSRDHLRTAITGAVLVTYLFILSFTTFTTVSGANDMSPISSTMVDSLTSLVTVTVAFYFGATAAVQIFGKGETNKEDSDNRPSEASIKKP